MRLRPPSRLEGDTIGREHRCRGEGRAAPTGADFTAIPNGWDGLTIQNGADHNVVTLDNFIARNIGSGIYIAGGAASQHH